jgi:hypothetical protein
MAAPAQPPAPSPLAPQPSNGASYVREAADTPWQWFEAHKQQEQPNVTERSARPSLVQETARQSSMRE